MQARKSHHDQWGTLFDAFAQVVYKQLMQMSCERRSHVGEAMIDELEDLWNAYNVERK